MLDVYIDVHGHCLDAEQFGIWLNAIRKMSQQFFLCFRIVWDVASDIFADKRLENVVHIFTKTLGYQIDTVLNWLKSWYFMTDVLEGFVSLWSAIEMW